MEALKRFFRTESAGGITMLVFAALAMFLANSPFRPAYEELLETRASFGGMESMFFKDFVKDVLMVFFFLLIGMELKKEAADGFLAKREQILLPLFAAIGGTIIPAAVFLTLNHGIPQNHAGWAIPTATDIAFAICVLNIFGRHISPAIKIFLLTLAIFDDIGAILIIAVFYNHGFTLLPFGLALLGTGVLYLLNRKNIQNIWVYVLGGIYLWFCFYYSGIHTTVAGIMVALAMPMSVIEKLINGLNNWVSFFILPVFALASAGVDISPVNIHLALTPLPLGIGLGLFLGKQIGVFLTCFVAIKLKVANITMPQGANWMHIYAVSVLAGIGFTMSLFIGALAFSSPGTYELVKLGVIGGSLISAVFGAVILRLIK